MIYIINPLKLIYFFTIWALGLHYLGTHEYIPNTFTLGVFVLLVSQIFYWIYPGYYHKFKHDKEMILVLVINDVLTHYIPLLFLRPSNDIRVLVVSLLLYISTFGFRKIIYIYKNIDEFLELKKIL
jgi:hypothetical protein